MLKPRQKQYLRGLAHPLAPVVRVGKGGVSAAVIAETEKTFRSHELIKVRIDGHEASGRKVLAESLATAIAAQIAGVIGKTVILYRANVEKPVIKLPA